MENKKHYLFHLGHPAHFHLFKNPIKALAADGNLVSIVIKKKDVLEMLLQNAGLKYVNLLPKGRSDNKFGIFLGMLKTDYNLWQFCRKNRPDLLIGTSYAISHVGKLLSIPLYAKLSYPWASIILSPTTCLNGKWENKSIKYAGYHELSYLHPNHFKADKNIAASYIDLSKPYTIIRFSSFNAHHDKGISGITNSTASQLIQILGEHSQVFITSERNLSSEFEPFKLKINPIDMHHVMAFAKLYIGDSQTMAAEAGVLGVLFIRLNDFVGRLGYLNELENTYHLGYGFKPAQKQNMLNKARELVASKSSINEIQINRTKMLSEKIDVAAFLTWFIQSYPYSEQTLKKNPDYQCRFRF
jgi:predicted glycosyltransferase